MTEKSETQKQTKNRQGVQGQKRGDTIWKPGKKKKKEAKSQSLPIHTFLGEDRPTHKKGQRHTLCTWMPLKIREN